MANVDARIDTVSYRPHSPPRSRARRQTGWLTTFALILAEAALAIVLVIIGVTLFAKVKVASQTLSDLRAAGPLPEPRLIGIPPPVPLPDRRIETIVAVADSPTARATEPPAATISIVGQGDVAAFAGSVVAITLEAQVPPAPIVQAVATPAPAEETRITPAEPPVAPPAPIERSDGSTVAAPSLEPETTAAIAQPPSPVATVAVEPPAAPPSATDVHQPQAAPTANPAPAVSIAAAPDPASIKRKPAKPRHVAKKPRPRERAAAKRPRVRQARAVTPAASTGSATTPRGSSPAAMSSSMRYFQDR